MVSRYDGPRHLGGVTGMCLGVVLQLSASTPTTAIGVMTPKKAQLEHHAQTHPRHPTQVSRAATSTYHSIY